MELEKFNSIIFDSMNDLAKIAKLILAVLLLLCLIDWPYGYFQFVRFSATAGFIYLAYDASSRKQSVGVAIFIFLAILFQPFEKIALGRALWNVVDVIVALGLIISMFAKNSEKK